MVAFLHHTIVVQIEVEIQSRPLKLCFALSDAQHVEKYRTLDFAFYVKYAIQKSKTGSATRFPVHDILCRHTARNLVFVILTFESELQHSKTVEYCNQKLAFSGTSTPS